MTTAARLWRSRERIPSRPDPVQPFSTTSRPHGPLTPLGGGVNQRARKLPSDEVVVLFMHPDPDPELGTIGLALADGAVAEADADGEDSRILWVNGLEVETMMRGMLLPAAGRCPLPAADWLWAMPPIRH